MEKEKLLVLNWVTPLKIKKATQFLSIHKVQAVVKT